MNIITDMHYEMGAFAFKAGQPFDEHEGFAWKRGWNDAETISRMDWSTGKALPKADSEPCQYTDMTGELITVDCLDWLENARYWEPADPADDTCGEWLPCARYYIGEVDGDSASVWLNDDMQEVQP